jgi:hypothetical protein
MPNPEDIQNPLWDDPRGLRWDEFYWDGPPPSLSPTTQPTKTKTMPKKPFMPKNEADQPAWLDRLVDALQNSSNGYAIKYNVPAATITLLDNGRQWVNAIVTYLAALRSTSQSLTKFKDQLFTGRGAITPPVAPVFTPPAVPLTAGVMTLAATVGVGIKDSINYAEADGEAMGLEGAVIVAGHAGSVSPDLSKSRIASGGFNEIVWKKDRYTAIKILVDRHDGKGEVFLAIDTQPNYIDTVKPAAGATAVYTYRGIYLLGDEEFGQWSQPFEITVRG